MVRVWMTVAGLLAVAGPALAQAPTPPPDAPPATTLGWFTLMLPALVPLLIAAAKWAVPYIPSAAIPIAAPLLGAAINILGYYAGLADFNPMWAAIFGALGVALREIVD